MPKPLAQGLLLVYRSSWCSQATISPLPPISESRVHVLPVISFSYQVITTFPPSSFSFSGQMVPFLDFSIECKVKKCRREEILISSEFDIFLSKGFPYFLVNLLNRRCGPPLLLVFHLERQKNSV